MNRLALLLMMITNYSYTDEAIYEPNYIYGSQPLGTYIGGFVQNSYSGEFISNNYNGTQFVPQSGQPMEMSQFIQGQEQLMLSNSKDKMLQKTREQEIGNNLQKEYYRQIHYDNKNNVDSTTYSLF